MRYSAKGLYLNKYKKFLKKVVAILRKSMYNHPCCDMIAMKREVATRIEWVFRGAKVM